MTGTVIKHTVSRALVLAGAFVVVGSVVLAGPASAGVPEGWPETDEVDTLFVLGVLVGIPVLLFVLITLAVYAPGLVRGERVAPGAGGPQDQWLGGRRDAGAIGAGPTSGTDDAATADGGASARW